MVILKLNRRIIALITVITILITAIAIAIPISAASDNTVSLTLYNDTTIPGGLSSPPAVKDVYTWEKSENTTDVFRLVIDMNLSKKYSAGEIELTIDGLAPVGRDEPLKRTSFGNASGVFKEVSEETYNKGIVVTNTTAINGSATLSVSYQLKPEEVTDLGTLNKNTKLKCTLKTGSETATSNEILFTTKFEQGWSIINSGDHDEAYDEIEVYEVNDNAPFMHPDRLETIDNIVIDETKVSESNYYWVEYRVPLLSHDPLGLYKHYIEISMPNDAAFFSAQAEAEDAHVTIPEELKYTIDSKNNCVVVDCAEHINKPHSAEDTDSYYYFVIALNKKEHNNTNVISFKEKHIHKDDNSVSVYSENRESYSQNLWGWGVDETGFSSTQKLAVGISKDSFKNGYMRTTTPVVFKALAGENIRINSTVPFIASATNGNGKTELDITEFSLVETNIPAHYLNDNGEVVYGINYELYTSTDGLNYSEFKKGSITEDVKVTLPDGTKFAYVIYSPANTSTIKSFYTYGMGDYSYKVSPTFTYKFFVNDITYSKIEAGTHGYVAIGAKPSILGKSEPIGSLTNYISAQDFRKEYALFGAEETYAKLAKNYYDITANHKIDLYSNSIQSSFNHIRIFAVVPNNYYKGVTNNTTILLNKVRDTVSIVYGDDRTYPVITKNNQDGSREYVSVTPENIKNYVTVNAETTNAGNAIIAFDIDFGDYSLPVSGKIETLYMSFVWPMSRLSEKDYGVQKTFDMISAIDVLDTSAANAATGAPLVSENNSFSALDNGSFAETVSSVSITKDALSDINKNNKTDEKLYFSKTSILVTDTGETAQATTIEVETEYTPMSTTTYSEPAITRSNKDYTLSFSFSGYGSEYSKLLFISNLGNAAEDSSDWHGTLKSVNNAVSASQTSLTTKIYYKTSVVNIRDAVASCRQTNDITVPSGWTESTAYKGNLSDVKAVAVMVSGNIVTEDIISIRVNMVSNADRTYDNLYNSVNFASLALSKDKTVTSDAYSENIVIKQINPSITYVKRIEADSVNLSNGTPTFIVEINNSQKKMSFPIVFNEGYTEKTIDGVRYYEKSILLTDETDFDSYTTKEIASLRYKDPYLAVSKGKVGMYKVEFSNTFDSPNMEIISTSRKIKNDGLSHNDLIINSFDNPVQ